MSALGLLVGLLISPVSADEDLAIEGPIRSAMKVKMLPAEIAEQKLEVELHGVVTCVPDGWKGFFIEDESGGIYCEPENADAERSFWPLRAGEEITLKGFTAPGHRNSFVAVASVSARQRGVFPQPPLRTIQQVIDDRVDADFVTVRGHIVGMVNIAGQMEYGLLADGVEALVLHAGFRVDPKVYELSEVEVSGVVIPQETEARKVKIIVPDAGCFKLLATHLDVQAATPKQPIQEILSRPTGGSPLVHISADIFCNDRDRTWLSQNGYGINWKSSGVLLPEGTRHVELMAVQKHDGVKRWLEHATVLSTDNSLAESRPTSRIADGSLDSRIHQIVSVTADFWDASTINSELVLSFDAGNRKLTCRLPGRSDTNQLPKLQRGAEYRITGLLSAVSEGSLETHELLVQTETDIVQISGPPWPLRFTLNIVSFLSVALALGLGTAIYHWKQATSSKQRLENARNELRIANESLEARVASRTMELDLSNRRLIDEAAARRRVEEERMQTLASLEEAQSIAQIGSFEWDAITNTCHWSRQCYVVHGLDQHQPAPDPDRYHDLVAEVDRPAFDRYMKQVTDSSEREEHRYRIVMPNGEVRWVRSLIRSIRDDAGCVRGMDGIIQDVTDLVAAEEQLRHSMKMEVAGRLAGGIAHDLNNTLTIIQLNCFMLDAELRALAIGDETRSYLVAIENASEKSAMLTRQLLTFSRKQIVRPVELNVNATIASFTPLLKQLSGDSIQIECSLEENVSDIRLDPGQMEQILMNLVLNARDAICDSGQVRISTSHVLISDDVDTSKWVIPPKPGQYVSLRVSDTGAGISAESMHAIFEPFFSTKGPDKGTGLGLSVVHGIVRQCNGGLFVDSIERRGTAFHVLIPATRTSVQLQSVAETPAEISNKASAFLPQSSRNESILLVDDEPAVGRNTENVLKRLGYRVTTVNSATEALELVRNNRGDFKLLITDYSMPSMLGTELARQIRGYVPSIPVIVMSGFLNEAAFNSLPVDLNPAYVQKPFTIQQLATAVFQSLATTDSLSCAAG